MLHANPKFVHLRKIDQNKLNRILNVTIALPIDRLNAEIHQRGYMSITSNALDFNNMSAQTTTNTYSSASTQSGSKGLVTCKR